MKNLKTLVFEALDNAFENDYDMIHDNPMEVADDLVLYDSSLEDVEDLEDGLDPKLLVEHVKDWQDSKRKKTQGGTKR